MCAAVSVAGSTAQGTVMDEELMNPPVAAWPAQGPAPEEPSRARPGPQMLLGPGSGWGGAGGGGAGLLQEEPETQGSPGGWELGARPLTHQCGTGLALPARPGSSEFSTPHAGPGEELGTESVLPPKMGVGTPLEGTWGLLGGNSDQVWATRAPAARSLPVLSACRPAWPHATTVCTRTRIHTCSHMHTRAHTTPCICTRIAAPPKPCPR